MPLTSEELRTFATDGLIIRRDFVPADLIDRAKTLIDDWYVRDMDHAQLTAYTQRTFAPDLGGHPDLLALLTQSGLAELAGDLLDDYKPVNTVQIQIRVPDTAEAGSQPEKPMHVDGVACPHLDPDELRTFSLLIGVVLSNISDPASGALRYVPGGHLRMSNWFRNEWALGLTDQVPPQVDSEHGQPLLGSPGDVLVMHHLVPHAAGHNLTASPRVMAYFRLSHVDHADRRLDALRDPWLDYPALNAALADHSAMTAGVSEEISA